MILIAPLFSLWVAVTHLQALLTSQATELAGSLVAKCQLSYLKTSTYQCFLKPALKAYITLLPLQSRRLLFRDMWLQNFSQCFCS